MGWNDNYCRDVYTSFTKIREFIQEFIRRKRFEDSDGCAGAVTQQAYACDRNKTHPILTFNTDRRKTLLLQYTLKLPLKDDRLVA